MPAGWTECKVTFAQGKRQGLFPPGVVIETEGGNRYLVGEINELGGVCDDCPAFPSKTIITRYMKLIHYANGIRKG